MVGEPAAKPASSDEILGARAYTHFRAATRTVGQDLRGLHLAFRHMLMNAPAAIQWGSQIPASLRLMFLAPFYPGADTLRNLHREPATARDILSPSVFSHFSLDKPRIYDSLLVWSFYRQFALFGNWMDQWPGYAPRPRCSMRTGEKQKMKNSGNEAKKSLKTKDHLRNFDAICVQITRKLCT